MVGPKNGGKRPPLAELQKLKQSGAEGLYGASPEFASDRKTDRLLRSGASCLRIIESNGVLVAVRVRPLNKKEQDAHSPEFFQVATPTSINVSGAGRSFAFDCVFPSHATQTDVFDRTARPLLHRVLDGYNGCLFAYGQTGSGKTHTMVGEGSGSDAGIIPLLCTELFDRVAERKASKLFTVQCSLLEIYNEALNDLLVVGGQSQDLQIREDTSLGGCGIHVDGITEAPVDSTTTLLSLMASGQKRRAVGQTNMNEHSSRSHMVLTLQVTASEVDDTEGVARTVSKLHLIDLAGSERQKATGATGDRLKEGAQINLSLSSLGNVINALTEPKAVGAKRRHVPYRDSKLTRLLQDSLGGNAFTVMICNISPAQMNEEETTSSLRFAERAKKVENQATVNRDPKAARLAELLQENKALRDKVEHLESYVEKLEEHYE